MVEPTGSKIIGKFIFELGGNAAYRLTSIKEWRIARHEDGRWRVIFYDGRRWTTVALLTTPLECQEELERILKQS